MDMDGLVVSKEKNMNDQDTFLLSYPMLNNFNIRF